MMMAERDMAQTYLQGVLDKVESNGSGPVTALGHLTLVVRDVHPLILAEDFFGHVGGELRANLR